MFKGLFTINIVKYVKNILFFIFFNMHAIAKKSFLGSFLCILLNILFNLFITFIFFKRVAALSEERYESCTIPFQNIQICTLLNLKVA